MLEYAMTKSGKIVIEINLGHAANGMYIVLI